MNFFLKLLPLIFMSNLYAQVGIGTTNPNAALEIKSSTDGLLIPRVSLVATNIETIDTPTISELVYNINTSEEGPHQVFPGFYYWNGTLWVPLKSENNNGWSINGNENINSEINYLGTSDENDLVLKTNSVDRFHIDSDGNIGINETNPDSKIDIINNNISGNSIEISHGSSNSSSAILIKNNGINKALNAQNLDLNSNSPVAKFSQMGNGYYADGVVVEMDNNTSSSSIGLVIDQKGFGYGEFVKLNSNNSSSGIAIEHQGAGNGLYISQNGTGNGIYNDVDNGTGIINIIKNNNTGINTILESAGGTGENIDLGIQDGIGVNVTAVDDISSPFIGGNVYSFLTRIKTYLPTTGGVINGAAFIAVQSGIGHGIYVQHNGTQGRNAEFNIENSSNPDPALITIHKGPGSAIIAQNQDNTITGRISVGNFTYTGTDLDDHMGIYGKSIPSSNWGFGIVGEGGYYGVFSIGDFGASGVKTFQIDHPLDPENKSLKHFSIESNEVLNFYRGNSIFDENGKATVKLPNYFNSININFSYQLTPIGVSMPNIYISKKINENGVFEISGGIEGSEVSWNVYANRNDKYIQENPEKIISEIEKEGERKGKYWDYYSWKQPIENGILFTKSSEPQISSMIKENVNSKKKIDKIDKLKKTN